jgi:hypothetical protein
MFWAGISFTNVGEAPLTSMVGHLFDAKGAHWLIELPRLDVMNKRTLLLIHENSGVTLTDLDSDASYQPVPLGHHAKLGNLRSSLFVVGCGTTRSRYDLDGIVLLGHDSDTEGSYLARKLDVGVCPQEPKPGD